MIRWRDISVLNNARDAMHAIDVAVANISYPVEAIELVGSRDAKESCPAQGWDSPVPVEHLQAWRERIATHATLRWQAIARARLLHDVIEEAARQLEVRASKLMIPLPRSPVDTLVDAILLWRERQ